MTGSVGPRPPVDLGTTIGPYAREHLAGTVQLIERDAGLHDALVRDAHRELGSPGATPLEPWSELQRSNAIARDRPYVVPDPAVTELRARDAHALRVDLGTQARLPHQPLGEDAWTVVGVGGSDRIQLGRTRDDGSVQRRTARWAELVPENPALAEAWAGAGAEPRALRPMQLHPDTPQALVDAWEGHRATLPEGDHTWEVVGGHPAAPRVVASGPWRELSRDLGLSRLRPLGALPSDAYRALVLADHARPTPTAVIAGEGSALFGQELLVSAGAALPTDHRAAGDVRLLGEISDWFAKIGLPTWRDRGDSMLLTTGTPDSIANASAFGDSTAAFVTTGPRLQGTVRSLTKGIPRDLRDAVRGSDDAIRRSFRAVLAHEVGHVANLQLWGVDVDTQMARAVAEADLATVARLAEHGVVGEAFSDLLGAAFADTDTLGIRDLGRLRNGFGDLDQLRATIARAGLEPEEHTGTQLITKPMLAVQRERGSTAMAEVTAHASKRLAAMLGRSEIDAIDIPTAAAALRDSAAMRWGADDALVRGLTEAWTALRVLR